MIFTPLPHLLNSKSNYYFQCDNEQWYLDWGVGEGVGLGEVVRNGMVQIKGCVQWNQFMVETVPPQSDTCN